VDMPLSTRVAVVGSDANETNREIVAAWRERGLVARLVPGPRALELVEPDELVLARLDVVPTLDGVEPGLLGLLLLERRGYRVLNGACALVAVHDKLATASRLAAAGIPHPRTRHVRARVDLMRLAPPLVLKPRFGSWGRDVFRCRNAAELAEAAAVVCSRPWFRRHGVLAQVLVPSHGRDLRLLVAGGAVVGAVERVAAPGEWRTNVSLGGSRVHADPDADACATAVAAALSTGADVVGVDLLPTDSGCVVLELNGAVEFNALYARGDGDVYADLARAVGVVPTRVTSRSQRIALR
jgi:RimK family alpha-L-glutamate ligase